MSLILRVFSCVKSDGRSILPTSSKAEPESDAIVAQIIKLEPKQELNIACCKLW